jgi:hypothetical protein
MTAPQNPDTTTNAVRRDLAALRQSLDQGRSLGAPAEELAPVLAAIAQHEAVLARGGWAA